MNKRLSKKQKWFKQIKPTTDDKMYVGIDVYKESCSVAVWLNDAPAIDLVTPADKKKLTQALTRHTVPFRWSYRGKKQRGLYRSAGPE